MKSALAIRSIAVSLVLACSANHALACEDGEPFHHMFTLVLNNGAKTGNAKISVPDGRRLIIEHVSLAVFVPAKSGQNLIAAVRTVAKGQEASHFIAPAVSVGAWSASMDTLLASHPARIYADANTEVGIGLDRTVSTAGQASIRVTVSGRLIEP